MGGSSLESQFLDFTWEKQLSNSVPQDLLAHTWGRVGVQGLLVCFTRLPLHSPSVRESVRSEDWSLFPSNTYSLYFLYNLPTPRL